MQGLNHLAAAEALPTLVMHGDDDQSCTPRVTARVLLRAGS
jgi:alpha-beta hydrolase superfamily lysophospholipase